MFLVFIQVFTRGCSCAVARRGCLLVGGDSSSVVVASRCFRRWRQRGPSASGCRRFLGSYDETTQYFELSRSPPAKASQILRP
jgi:hypothetical protein